MGDIRNVNISATGATVVVGENNRVINSGSTNRPAGSVAPAQPTFVDPKPSDAKVTSGVANWTKLAWVCAILAVVFEAVLYFLPDNQSRAWVAVPVGTFLAVFLLVLSLNPIQWYRRCAFYALSLIGLSNAIGFALEAWLPTQNGLAWLHWDGTTGIGGNIVLACLVIFFAIMDYKVRKQ